MYCNSRCVYARWGWPLDRRLHRGTGFGHEGNRAPNKVRHVYYEQFVHITGISVFYDQSIWSTLFLRRTNHGKTNIPSNIYLFLGKRQTNESKCAKNYVCIEGTTAVMHTLSIYIHIPRYADIVFVGQCISPPQPGHLAAPRCTGTHAGHQHINTTQHPIQ